MSSSWATPTSRSATARLRAAPRRLQRALLRRRRSLAAVCLLIAVVSWIRATEAPTAPTITVAVAARDLAAGTVLAARDVVTREFAPGTVPDARIRDPVGRVLATALSRGSPLTTAGLVGPGLVTGAADRTATPVRLPDSAMAELLTPGDRVDVLAADPRGGSTTTVARDALVLALPPSPSEAAADGLPGRLVVLGLRESEVAAVSAVTVSHFLIVVWSG